MDRPQLIAGAARDGADTPRSAFALLSWRVNVVVVVALVALSLLAWRSTIDDAHTMRKMAMGLGQIGVLNQGMMGAGVFLTMWSTMMIAMMLPTIAPMVLAHQAVVRRRGDGPLATVAFVGGYLIVWAAIGIVPMIAYWGFTQLPDDAAQSRWLPAVAGAVFIVAGVYQFTGWKRVCLDQCQSPLAFVAQHDFERGAASSFGAGIMHGAACLGCCWAAMTVLLVVGLMNLVWMVVLFALFLVEKNWKHGAVLSKVAGAALVALGIAMIAHPPLLAQISS